MNGWLLWLRGRKEPRVVSAPGQHVISARRLHQKYGAALDDIQTLFLSLGPDRIGVLLDDYAAAYGAGARRYAKATYAKWRDGEVTMAGQTMTRLLDLLPRHMTPDEKLTLIQHLRAQTLLRLHRAQVRLTLHDRADLSAVVRHVAGLTRRVSDIPLPDDFREVQGWITLQDTQALTRLARQTEQFVAASRLADLIVQLSLVTRLLPLAEEGWRVRAHTRFDIPTAHVEITFKPSFWRKDGPDMAPDSDENFLVRLQEMALRQERQEGSLTFVEYVMRTLTPEEQEKLRAVAAAEGLKAEVLLRELQVKTIAARGDIEATIATAEELKKRGHAGKITSEHSTASGTTRIEIENKDRPCYIAIACYVDASHPDVRALRAFRDAHLQPRPLGRVAVSVYNALSPPLARHLGRNRPLAGLVRRVLLRPLAERLGRRLPGD